MLTDVRSHLAVVIPKICNKILLKIPPHHMRVATLPYEV